MGELLELIGDSAGWIVGIGVTLGVASAFSDGAKPLAKKAIKGYLNAADRARVAVAEMGEQLQDLYAEAKAEYEATNNSPEGASSPIIVPGR